MSRHKRSGHFCWCCGRSRPNEAFSGRGHARHLCKECAKLAPLELLYRQAIRDIDRLIDWDGLIRRKQRATFQRFMSHDDVRVQVYAAQLAAHDAQLRTQRARDDDDDDEGELAPAGQNRNPR